MEVLRGSDSALYRGREAESRGGTSGTEGCREMEDRENQGPQHPYQSLSFLRCSRGMLICICIIMASIEARNPSSYHTAEILPNRRSQTVDTSTETHAS